MKQNRKNISNRDKVAIYNIHVVKIIIQDENNPLNTNIDL